MRSLFTDKEGKLSSKRVVGTIIVATAIVLTILERGDPETVRTMIWAGFASIGVGTLETRVSK